MRVVTMIVLFMLTGLGVAVGWSILSNRAGDPLAVVPITVSSLRLNIPAGYFRSGIVPKAGAVERADLVVQFPNMSASGRPPGTMEAIQALDPRTLVFIGLLRADGGPDPAERPQDIYGRFLEPDTWQNPGGLILRRFESTSPYADEELFLAPPDGRVFSARCRRSDLQPAALKDACLWRLRIEDVDVQVRFSQELLPQWESLVAGVRSLLERWLVR